MGEGVKLGVETDGGHGEEVVMGGRCKLWLKGGG